MMMPVLISIAAGLASALMFASVISGAAISFVLFYLAPLPLMVAALGWGHIVSLMACGFAALGLGLSLGVAYMIAFVVTVALPAWWLGRLALLARPLPTSDVNGAPALEWYPTGRLLLWIALFASITTVAALMTISSDAGTILDTLHRGLSRLLTARSGPDASVNDAVVRVMVQLAVIAATAIALTTLTLSLWLSAKIAAISGHLRRPWPELRATVLPPMTLALLAAAIICAMTAGLPALAGQILSAALLIAYGLTGLAVLHAITVRLPHRGLWLGLVYAVVVMFGWPLLAVSGLGIADAVFGIRGRFGVSRVPPSSTT